MSTPPSSSVFQPITSSLLLRLPSSESSNVAPSPPLSPLSDRRYSDASNTPPPSPPPSPLTTWQPIAQHPASKTLKHKFRCRASSASVVETRSGHVRTVCASPPMSRYEMGEKETGTQGHTTPMWRERAQEERWTAWNASPVTTGEGSVESAEKGREGFAKKMWRLIRGKRKKAREDVPRHPTEKGASMRRISVKKERDNWQDELFPGREHDWGPVGEGWLEDGSAVVAESDKEKRKRASAIRTCCHTDFIMMEEEETTLPWTQKTRQRSEAIGMRRELRWNPRGRIKSAGLPWAAERVVLEKVNIPKERSMYRGRPVEGSSVSSYEEREEERKFAFSRKYPKHAITNTTH